MHQKRFFARRALAWQPPLSEPVGPPTQVSALQNHIGYGGEDRVEE